MKQTQIGYKVVEVRDITALNERVQNLIDQGWQTSGDLLCVTPPNIHGEGKFLQPMVLLKETAIKDYTIIDEEDPNKFIGEVNLLLQNGWELQGGASVSHLVGEQHGMEYHGHRFVQAVVKY